MNIKKGFAWLPVLLVILGVLAVSGGAYYFVHQNTVQPPAPIYQPDTTTSTNTQTTNTQTTTNTPVQNTTSSLKTYTNTQYGFSVQYPSSSQITPCQQVVEGAPPSLCRNASPVVVFDSTIGIFVSSDAQASQYCMDAQVGKEPIAKTFNGISFAMSSEGDLAAGTAHENVAYATLRGGTCYTIEADFSGPTIGFDDTQIKAKLESIVKTFHFTTDAQVNASNAISVPGMSQYTDSSFGFSFWYPSNWGTLKEINPVDNYVRTFQGETVVKEFSIDEQPPIYGTWDGSDNVTNRIRIFEINSSSRSISDEGTGKTPSQTYFFDVNTHTWMQGAFEGEFDGLHSTSTADVSNNSMGGLHIFHGGGWPQASNIIPLSATKFVVFDVGSDNFKLDTLAKTMVALDPSVATPVSAAQQTATIQAEKDAYSGQ